MGNINVTRSSMPPFDEYMNEIKDIWETHWLTNMGSKHIEFESKIKDYFKCKYISLFSNGHLALEAVIDALELTGEIITTPFTFISTTNAIIRRGCKPIFCDITENDYTIDARKIEKLITNRTSAILPVHVYGNICDYQRIAEIANEYGLRIIYDAAHAFGVQVKGTNVANFGDASMFSFHATKVFNTIEGGAVTCSDQALKSKLDCIKNFGIISSEEIALCGGNAKMNEFQAAMGICNLRHIDNELDKRSVVYKRYYTNLSGISGIELCTIQENTSPNYAYFPVIFSGYKYSRDEICNRLCSNGYIPRKYFYPLTNEFKFFIGKQGFDSKNTPIAKHISESVLTLPMYADLSLNDVDNICEIVLS